MENTACKSQEKGSGTKDKSRNARETEHKMMNLV